VPAVQKPNAGAKVTLRYTARLVDGTVFDERGEGNELEAVTEDGASLRHNALMLQLLGLSAHHRFQLLMGHLGACLLCMDCSVRCIPVGAPQHKAAVLHESRIAANAGWNRLPLLGTV